MIENNNEMVIEKSSEKTNNILRVSSLFFKKIGKILNIGENNEEENCFIIPRGRNPENENEIFFKDLESLEYKTGNSDLDEISFINFIMTSKEYYLKRINNVPIDEVLSKFMNLDLTEEDKFKLREKALKTIDNMIEKGYVIVKNGNITVNVRTQSIHSL